LFTENYSCLYVLNIVLSQHSILFYSCRLEAWVKKVKIASDFQIILIDVGNELNYQRSELTQSSMVSPFEIYEYHRDTYGSNLGY
jgi:hypothetical protein